MITLQRAALRSLIYVVIFFSPNKLKKHSVRREDVYIQRLPLFSFRGWSVEFGIFIESPYENNILC